MFSHLDQPPWRATSANAQTVSSPLCRPIAIRVSKTSSRVCSRWWPDSASASRARSPSWDRWNSAQRATPSWRLASVAAYAPPRSQAPTRPAASPTDTSTAPDAWATTVGKPCAAHSRATEIHAGGTAASAGPGARPDTASPRARRLRTEASPSALKAGRLGRPRRRRRRPPPGPRSAAPRRCRGRRARRRRLRGRRPGRT